MIHACLAKDLYICICIHYKASLCGLNMIYSYNRKLVLLIGEEEITSLISDVVLELLRRKETGERDKSEESGKKAAGDEEVEDQPKEPEKPKMVRCGAGLYPSCSGGTLNSSLARHQGDIYLTNANLECILLILTRHLKVLLVS